MALDIVAAPAWGGDAPSAALTSYATAGLYAGGIEYVEETAEATCSRTKRDGNPCLGRATATGVCMAHSKD